MKEHNNLTKDQDVIIKDNQPEQLALFKSLSDSLVNTQSLRLWDSLVNVVFDDKKVVNRIEGKFLLTSSRSIEFEGKNIKITRFPARIIREEDEIDVFPMKKDYKVLEGLIKLAVDNEDTAFYTGKDQTLTVRASYYQLFSLVKRVTGKMTFSYKQIEESIDVLSKANIDFNYNDIQIKGSLISSFMVKKNEDEKKSDFIIAFHPIISKIVLMGGFREANLERIMNLKDMFTIFLYKKFLHNFKQASRTNSYHFSLNNVLKEYPSVASWKHITRKIEKVIESLTKLEKVGLIKSWKATRKYSEGKGQKKTIDCVFEVWFSTIFIDEQIKANKLTNKNLNIAPDGRVVSYPNVNDFTSKTAYLEELQLWHDLEKQNKKESIIGKIFSS